MTARPALLAFLLLAMRSATPSKPARPKRGLRSFVARASACAPISGIQPMAGKNTFAPIELKAFVPAKELEVSKRFHQEIGFILSSDSDGIAYFHHRNCAFLLQG